MYVCMFIFMYMLKHVKVEGTTFPIFEFKTDAIAGAWLGRDGDVEDRLNVRAGETYFD